MGWEMSSRRVCGFSNDPWALDLKVCGKPAVIHAAFEEEYGAVVSGVFGCEDHLARVMQMRAQVDRHSIGSWCGMPGTKWLWSTAHEEGCCVLDDSGEEPVLQGVVEMGASR